MLFTNLQTEEIKYKPEGSYKQNFYYLELIPGITSILVYLPTRKNFFQPYYTIVVLVLFYV